MNNGRYWSFLLAMMALGQLSGILLGALVQWELTRSGLDVFSPDSLGDFYLMLLLHRVFFALTTPLIALGLGVAVLGDRWNSKVAVGLGYAVGVSAIAITGYLTIFATLGDYSPAIALTTSAAMTVVVVSVLLVLFLIALFGRQRSDQFIVCLVLCLLCSLSAVGFLAASQSSIGLIDGASYVFLAGAHQLGAALFFGSAGIVFHYLAGRLVLRLKVFPLFASVGIAVCGLWGAFLTAAAGRLGMMAGYPDYPSLLDDANSSIALAMMSQAALMAALVIYLVLAFCIWQEDISKTDTFD